MELITPGILTKRKYPETHENQTENRHSAGRKKIQKTSDNAKSINSSFI